MSDRTHNISMDDSHDLCGPQAPQAGASVDTVAVTLEQFCLSGGIQFDFEW